MLTARGPAAGAALVVALIAAGAAAQSAAAKPDNGVECPPTKLNCDVHAQHPGTPGGSKPHQPGTTPAGGSSKPRCAIDGKTVPCSTDMGVFNPADSCYWKLLDPQPAPNDPQWTYAFGLPADWKPGDPGKLYNVVCPGVGRELAGGVTFSKTGPAGGGVNVQALAQEAVRKLQLRGADIGIAPKPTGRGTVGVPVWMWNIHNPHTTGPASATATAGPVSVTATATVGRVVWTMGDGHSVTCTTPGTPYAASFGMANSPDCGYMYQTTSGHQRDGKFHVTATTTWNVHWAGAGQQGDLTTTRTSKVALTIGEVQVLN